ncbi:MAG: hypothetical protein ACI9C1_000764, partial [Candidatus Aldehydirespiratoraceae bacterium]
NVTFDNVTFDNVTFDNVNLGVDLALGQTAGARIAGLDDATLRYSDLDVELTSGGCSFFLWEWAVEDLLEDAAEIMLDLAAILAANPGLQTDVTTLIQTEVNKLSFGTLLGGLVNLGSTVTLTTVVVQNGGREIQADASFMANGPNAGPNVPVSVAATIPPPNMNFLMSLRTVPTTGDQFGVGTWPSPALLNQLVASAVGEGVFARVDTAGSVTAGDFLLTGQCGMAATTPVFVDVAATTAPWRWWSGR